jgi:hypothetical protein
MAAGVLTFAASFVFPPAATILAPLGTGLVGLAIKTPGDVTKAQLLEHGENVAAAVAPAVLGALQTPGLSRGEMGLAVQDAAAQALANVGSTPKK